jgi:hypothetical protein
MKLVGGRRVGVTQEPMDIAFGLPPPQGRLRIVANQRRSATQLAALLLQASTRLSKCKRPYIEPECVPGQPNLTRPPASVRVDG